MTGSISCVSGSEEMIGSGALREDLTLFRIGSGESGESLSTFTGEKIEDSSDDCLLILSGD